MLGHLGPFKHQHFPNSYQNMFFLSQWIISQFSTLNSIYHVVTLSLIIVSWNLCILSNILFGASSKLGNIQSLGQIISLQIAEPKHQFMPYPTSQSANLKDLFSIWYIIPNKLCSMLFTASNIIQTYHIYFLIPTTPSTLPDISSNNFKRTIKIIQLIPFQEHTEFQMMPTWAFSISTTISIKTK